MSEQTQNQPMLAADGTPLKRSLARALRREKTRALLLIAPLLIFVLVTFIVPIGNMLLRSVENDIVYTTLPYTVEEIESWNPATDAMPGREVFKAAYYDMFLAAEAKEHTKLGTRLNYEQTGISSTFRKSGRAMDDFGKDVLKSLGNAEAVWKNPQTLHDLMATDTQYPDKATTMMAAQAKRLSLLKDRNYSANKINVDIASEMAKALPLTAREYASWAAYVTHEGGKDAGKGEPWEAVYVALMDDLQNPLNTKNIEEIQGAKAESLNAARRFAATMAPLDYPAIMGDVNDAWAEDSVWRTIKTHASEYTSGYFLNAVDMRKTLDGPEAQPADKRILIKLFTRTVQMSLMITFSCILLGYPVAWLLANLPMRTSNLLMILVLLPFWTSLLVRTSAWKVMLQQQGVINEVLVWLGIVATDDRLQIINNQLGTIIAMTHILLPFMILPMYSVMQTIPPTYLRAAKSLGATNWTAFWRVYFPQSIPGIGAGSILVFILAIGYYITPEIVGGTDGVFISNRIAYHISSSLNWGLAAALGAILLAVVLVLYWTYDKIVGIDNVKLG